MNTQAANDTDALTPGEKALVQCVNGLPGVWSSMTGLDLREDCNNGDVVIFQAAHCDIRGVVRKMILERVALRVTPSTFMDDIYGVTPTP